jgi:Holliday junction resolvase
MPGGKAPRAAGDRFERGTVLRLRDAGYLVIRSAGSHGVADIVALRSDGPPILVQCKITDNMTARERATFRRLADHAGAFPVIAYRPGNRGVAYARINAEGERVPWLP